jgi:hypothetical protein
LHLDFGLQIKLGCMPFITLPILVVRLETSLETF